MDFMDFTPSAYHTLFRRCVTCPDITPSCPTCAPDEVCTQISENCDQCASRVCIKSSQAGTTPQINANGKAPNVGAIAGGVIGGVIVIAIATWLIWRFFIKNKQQVYDDVLVEEDEAFEVEKERFLAQRSARESTHTFGSLASSSFTRASNIIQIAFIPGITDRSGNNIPIMPPVPPVPIPTNPSPSAALSSGMDHYFMPSDLRDSTFTGYSDDSRDSIARQSLSPSLVRGSVASTIFRNGAVIDAEAVQTAHRGRAAVVSVKGSPTDTPPSGGVLAVPKIDYTRYPDIETQLTNFGSNTAGGPTRAPGLLQPTRFTRAPAQRGPTDMTAAITEATRRASHVPTHRGLGSLQQRDPSPFSDEHAI